MKQNPQRLLAVCLTAVAFAGTAADEPPPATVAISWDAGLPLLTFDLNSGTGYRVDERTNLLTGGWDEIGTGYALSGPDSHFLTFSAVGSRFYRLRYDVAVADTGDGEESDTFDFSILSNRVDALQTAHWNNGNGDIVIITNYLAGTYETLTDQATLSNATVTTTLQSYEGTNGVYQHLTSDTILVFTPASVSMPLSVRPDDEVAPTLKGSSTSGGIGLRFPGSHAFRDGEKSRLDIVVRGNVITAGNFSFDFGEDPLSWTPPSIGERIRDLWLQGPPPFDPCPPTTCGDSLSIANARMFSVLETKTTVYSEMTIEESYDFLFDYCYEYTCPSGPLRKILVAVFRYSVVVRNSSGIVIDRSVQTAYYVNDQMP